jgi:hypothetical protein
MMAHNGAERLTGCIGVPGDGARVDVVDVEGGKIGRRSAYAGEELFDGARAGDRELASPGTIGKEVGLPPEAEVACTVSGQRRHLLPYALRVTVARLPVEGLGAEGAAARHRAGAPAGSLHLAHHVRKRRVPADDFCTHRAPPVDLRVREVSLRLAAVQVRIERCRHLALEEGVDPGIGLANRGPPPARRPSKADGTAKKCHRLR